MKLVRFGPPGREKPGMIDADGVLRDLSRKVTDIDGAALAPVTLSGLRKLDTKRLPAVKGRPRLGPCIATPSKFVAIGLNYIDHAKETGSPIPEHPIVFFKSQTSIVGANDSIMLPLDSSKVDWEVELGVVIGRTARYVAEKDALRYVAGYCVVNDVSEREFQMHRSAAQWTKGKGCDTFGPIGPWLVTSDEIRDPQNLDMWLDVNGERRQTGNTRTMIFNVAQLVWVHELLGEPDLAELRLVDVLPRLLPLRRVAKREHESDVHGGCPSLRSFGESIWKCPTASRRRGRADARARSPRR